MVYNVVYFCTGNAGKFNEVKQILEPEFTVIQLKMDLTEIQAVDTEKVCKHKLMEAVNQLHCDVGGHSIPSNYVLLVEDTGLGIHATNGFPGALIKFYLDYVKPEGICQLHALSGADMCVTMAAYFSQTKESHVWSQRLHGMITERPKGTMGFGFDSIFECVQHPENLTLAQMMQDVKADYNPRAECAKLLKLKMLSHTSKS